MDSKTQSRILIVPAAYLLVSVFSAYGQTVLATIPGINGRAIAVNPVTNTIYVASWAGINGRGDAIVTVIDGGTHSATATITLASGISLPAALSLAVDPVNNKIYGVAVDGIIPNASTLTVIDGVSNAASTTKNANSIGSVVVNPVTGKYYETTGIYLAVNPITNKIYESTYNTITVVEGATNSTLATIAVNTGASGELAINPATNRIYVSGNGGIIVIDGASNSIITTISGATGPLVVNPVTNKIYTEGAVIDGATNIVTPISFSYGALAVNSTTNEIYVLNGNLTVIDGGTNAATTIPDVSGGPIPVPPAINPVTNEIYVAGLNGITVVAGATSSSAPPVPIQAVITPLPNDQTASSTPTFTFSATNNLTSGPVDNLLYQVDTLQGPWTSAVSNGQGMFTGTTAPLQPGTHTLYAFATDGEEGTSSATPGFAINFQSSNSLLGNISSYHFSVLSNGKIPETVSFTGAPPSAPYGSSFTVTATTNASVPATITSSGACTVVGNLVTMVTGNGTCLLTAIWPGDDTYLPASAIQSTMAVKGATTTTVQNLVTRPVGQLLTLTAMVTGPAGPVNEGIVTFSAPPPIGVGLTAPVINGVASVSGDTTPLVGVFTISAVYSGSANLTGSGGSGTLYVTNGGTSALAFVPVTPCRVADTRNPNGPFGGPELTGGSSRDFAIRNSVCSIPANAAAFSLNVTVVPDAQLGYLTIWPTGQAQPLVSTLNSDGRIKANAAIVPAGADGGVSVYVTDDTQVILDIDGYFVPVGSAPALAFYPLGPCRVADTRQGAPPFGGSLTAGETRVLPVLSSNCNIPSSAQAYSLNITAVPQNTLAYLTVWPTGQTQPFVSTLNAPTGAITANAAIVPTGTNGAISVYATDPLDLVIDVNGYFGPTASGAFWFYPQNPCRILDTRSSSGQFSGTLPVSVFGNGGGCAKYYGPLSPGNTLSPVLNATVVPPGPLNYLTLWAQGAPQPFVSTLNALDGSITSNMAVVTAQDFGAINAFSSNPTQLVLDIFGVFEP